MPRTCREYFLQSAEDPRKTEREGLLRVDETLIAESFDSRTLANMEVVLERVCKGPSIGAYDHSIRRHIAGKILKCTEAGDRTLGGLTVVRRAAATELRAVSAG
jgi:hypothetical protein